MKNLFNWFLKPFKKTTQKVQEYIYLDQYRLSKYIDQLRSPVTPVGLPSASFGINYQGPNAKAGYSSSLRSYTYFEQLSFLIKKLKQSNQLSEKRWNGSKSLADSFTFRMETCLATRLVIPQKDSDEKLTAWISRYDPFGERGQPSTLVLLEDVRIDDTVANYLSSYSQLFLLLGKSIPRLAISRIVTHQQFFKKSSEDLFKDMSAELVKNPVGFFKTMGAECFPERCIKTLYRVRDGCLADTPVNIPTAVSIGYPIYITEGEGQHVENKELYVNSDIQVMMRSEQFEKYLEGLKKLMQDCKVDDKRIQDELEKLRQNFNANIDKFS